MTSPLHLYLHWPWCLAKCPYCDFNSHTTPPESSAWHHACVQEIDTYADSLEQRAVHTVFIGGGTPSLIPPTTLNAVLDHVANRFTLAPHVEVTCEVNPTSATRPLFEAFRAAGVTRLSVGVQSLNDATLAFLGRQHSAEDARRTILDARAVFDTVSCDLIYAHRNQTCRELTEELTAALTLGTDHLSLYQLTLEPNTAFATRARRETLVVDSDHAAELYAITEALTAAAGRPLYEISNYARVGHECRHNQAVWQYEDYLGIGPGAHGRYHDPQTGNRVATHNHRHPDVWAQAVNVHGRGVAGCERIDLQTARHEALLMGLRLTEGIPHTRWHALFGESVHHALDPTRLASLQDAGYVILDDVGLRVTPSGRLRLDGILRYMVGVSE